MKRKLLKHRNARAPSSHARSTPRRKAINNKRLCDAKRAAMREEFFSRLFLPGGLPTGDTYKRFMWASCPDIALLPASYHLTMRKGLPEPGAGDQLVMAGHEAMLAQWFHRPLKRRDIETAAWWYSRKSAVTAFPHEMWQAILEQSSGQDVFLPVDIYGFPGGQTFLKGVPCMSFEGMGGAVSLIEAEMCRYFAPIIFATKARLMKQVTEKDAEFGLRAAPVATANLILLLARYVGGGARLTSNDAAEFMYPQLFKAVGTIGHELMCSTQSFEQELGVAEREMMDRIVTRMGQALLLTDLVDAETIGLENALNVIANHPETDKVGIRVDSGNIAEQCILYFKRLHELDVSHGPIVFEDEVDPEKIVEVYNSFRQATGQEPTSLLPGAGGYWWRGAVRDTVAAVFKRSATEDRPNVKFSNSPGKGSLGGHLRIYGQGDTLIIADCCESIDGKPLFVKLVEAGRIVYNESFRRQAARADATWGQYTKVALSAKIQQYKNRFEAMRTAEIAAARQRLNAT